MDAPTPIESSQAASDAKRARGATAWTEIPATGRLLLTNEFGLIALIAAEVSARSGARQRGSALA